MQIPILRRGGGGSTIETSTFTIDITNMSDLSYLSYSTIDENGKVVFKVFENQENFENTFVCLRNAPIVLGTSTSSIVEDFKEEGCFISNLRYIYGNNLWTIFPTEETAYITIYIFTGAPV